MAARRRGIYRKPKEYAQPSRKRPEMVSQSAGPGLEEKGPYPPETRVEGKKPAKETCLPIVVIMDILAKEYENSAQGEALCRAALRLAEESGAIESYRAKWNAEETDPHHHLSGLLFNRRQSLELIRYYERKGDQEALIKERGKLREIEGRLLLGGASPLRISEEDLEVLEKFIKESGF